MYKNTYDTMFSNDIHIYDMYYAYIDISNISDERIQQWHVLTLCEEEIDRLVGALSALFI